MNTKIAPQVKQTPLNDKPKHDSGQTDRRVGNADVQSDLQQT